jgi:hypothetical protein
MNIPTAKLIKNLNWEKEFKLQKQKAINKNLDLIHKYSNRRMTFRNVYGFQHSISSPINYYYEQEHWSRLNWPENVFDERCLVLFIK